MSLVGKGGREVGSADILAALRMAGDADPGNPVPVEEAGLQKLDRAPVVADRPVDAAADHQHFVDAGFPRQPLQVVVEPAPARRAARREMGHRNHPLIAEPPGGGLLA